MNTERKYLAALSMLVMALASVACRPEGVRPPIDGFVSIVVVATEGSDSSIVAIDATAPSTERVSAGFDELWMLGYQRPLNELGLSPGRVLSPIPGSPSRSLPATEAAFRFGNDGSETWRLSPLAPNIAALRFQGLTTNDCLLAGGCFDDVRGVAGEPACTTPCPSSDLEFEPEPPREPAEPEPPTLLPCAQGWTEEAATATRATSCREPTTIPPVTCGAASAQLFGSDHCTPVGELCPSGVFADNLDDQTTLFVQLGAPGGGNGTRGTPFATIAQALSSATPVIETIALSSGRFEEHVSLNRPVHLRGACAERTILVGQPLRETINVSETATISNLSVEAPYWGIVVQSPLTLSLRQVEIRADLRGVVVVTGGTLQVASVHVASIRDVAIELSDGAHFDADGLVMTSAGAQTGALFVGPGSIARLRGAALRQLRPGAGVGIWAKRDSTVAATQVSIEGPYNYGIIAQGARLTVDRVQLVGLDGEVSLLVREHAHVSGTALSIAGNSRSTLVSLDGSTVALDLVSLTHQSLGELSVHAYQSVVDLRRLIASGGVLSADRGTLRVSDAQLTNALLHAGHDGQLVARNVQGHYEVRTATTSQVTLTDLELSDGFVEMLGEANIQRMKQDRCGFGCLDFMGPTTIADLIVDGRQGGSVRFERGPARIERVRFLASSGNVSFIDVDELEAASVMVRDAPSSTREISLHVFKSKGTLAQISVEGGDRGIFIGNSTVGLTDISITGTRNDGLTLIDGGRVDALRTTINNVRGIGVFVGAATLQAGHMHVHNVSGNALSTGLGIEVQKEGSAHLDNVVIKSAVGAGVQLIEGGSLHMNQGLLEGNGAALSLSNHAPPPLDRFRRLRVSDPIEVP